MDANTNPAKGSKRVRITPKGKLVGFSDIFEYNVNTKGANALCQEKV